MINFVNKAGTANREKEVGCVYSSRRCSNAGEPSRRKLINGLKYLFDRKAQLRNIAKELSERGTLEAVDSYLLQHGWKQGEARMLTIMRSLSNTKGDYCISAS